MTENSRPICHDVLAGRTDSRLADATRRTPLAQCWPCGMSKFIVRQRPDSNTGACHRAVFGTEVLRLSGQLLHQHR